MALQRTPIDSGWLFKNASEQDSAYLPTAQFPTTIHVDLLKHGKIPDPFHDRNEAAVQWVGEETWVYRTTIPGPSGISDIEKAELVFEGLDTYTTIYLNSAQIQKTDNMNIAYRVDVTGRLQASNLLEIHFESTWLVGKMLEKEAKDKPLFCHNGDSSRLQVRKAQYHYGWDWGPTFLTCGPWKPIYLEVFAARFKDLSAKVDVSKSLSSARVETRAELESTSTENVKFELRAPDGNIIEEKIVRVESHAATASFAVQNPQLWYSIGNGPQPLYTVRASCLSDKSVSLCSTSKRIGLRRLKLIQRPLNDQPGTTFFFEINNTPIFSRGADWIPADSFLSRITTKKYRDWVEFAANGNHNMIRVWGGGIYEDEAFYDACDELGVLVWQDFMLGCGAYPATPKFLQQIKDEAVFNIKRMRHHASIVLWCGNNEDHMFADRYTPQYDLDDHNPDNWLKTNWPGRIIYDKVLKDICAEHIPETPYHPGSPWGGKPSNNPTIGDIHSWGVWMKALEQYPYQNYPNISGRFVSEFGVKSYPSLKTLESSITDSKERYPQSKTMDAHQKAASKTPWAGDNRNIALYMVENIKHGYSLPQYVYASQLVQAEAMMFAYTSWRRLWKGPGREECAGALAWQLNDCWPVVSWSLGDYYLRPKLAYYTIKRALTPLSVGIARVEIEISRKDELTRAKIDKKFHVQVWGSNFTTQNEPVELSVHGFDLDTGKCQWTKTLSITLLQNQSTELLEFEFPNPATAPSTIVCARISKGNKTIARFSDWPQPLRHLDLPKPEIKLDIRGDEIHIFSPVPVKGLEFQVSDDEVKFEDNCLDLIPGEELVVVAKGLRGREVGVMHLGIAAD